MIYNYFIAVGKEKPLMFHSYSSEDQKEIIGKIILRKWETIDREETKTEQVAEK